MKLTSRVRGLYTFWENRSSGIRNVCVFWAVQEVSKSTTKVGGSSFSIFFYSWNATQVEKWVITGVAS